MLIISTKPTEPEWTPVLGAEVLFAPIDRAAVLRARHAARAVSQAEPEDSDRSTIDLLDDMGTAVSHALIIAGARDWRGVATQRFDNEGEPVLEDGEPVFDDLPFTPENLDAALSDAITFDAFDEAYVRPFWQRERERKAPGKGSPRSPRGTGTKARKVRTTATSRAAASAARATNAPIGSTKRGRSKRKTSGES
ncbi:hypothetical protein KZ810_07985 [Sphingomonas sp. RHCKR47]|uniref:hypothetical protein n=1 Tax=Sphingomonas citricola TaxID=2862498 RepID=UPI001CA54FB2|nr:hypothetical protein [Sphingomonas citricola]MBW6523436.1 hypothetical protein [Sphingomonas citricola]